MTTIATDGRLLAADGRASRGEAVVANDRTKVFPLADGSIVGGAGRTRDAERALEALREDPRNPRKVKGDYTLMRLHRNGRVDIYEDQLSSPIRVRAPYAVGSGWREALGAMRAGANALTAIKIASGIDVYTGGKITSYER